MYKFYYGIDSGAKGAVALLVLCDGAIKACYVDDFPIDFKTFMCYMREGQEDERVKVMLEAVHALPGQSCTAMFSYGGNYKMAELMAYSLSPKYQTTSPQAWKKHFGLMKSKEETKSQYKKRSVQLARKLLGDFYEFKDSKDGQAEAALIALYAYEKDNA